MERWLVAAAAIGLAVGRPEASVTAGLCPGRTAGVDGSSAAHARCGRLGHTASQLAHLLVGEVVHLETDLLELPTDVHRGQDRVDGQAEFAQRMADARVVQGGRSVLRGLQQP